MLRHFVLLLSLLVFPTISQATQGVHIATGTNNVGTSFTTSFPQLALTLQSPTTKHLYVFNACTSPVALTFTNFSANVAPSSSTTTNPAQVFVGGSSSTQLNYMGAGKYIWLRSDGTTCSAGDIIINVW